MYYNITKISQFFVALNGYSINAMDLKIFQILMCWTVLKDFQIGVMLMN